MASGSDIGPVTCSCAAQSSSDKIFKALEDHSVRKAVAEIVDQDGGVENRMRAWREKPSQAIRYAWPSRLPWPTH